jgi:arylsulfatase A-like enzyme
LVRTRSFGTALAVVLTAALALAGSAHAAPNILFIVTDDQRLDGTMAVMPKTVKWFKNGDAAAGILGGTEFTTASATTPLCCPSRASIVSGNFAHNHGVRSNTMAANLNHDRTIQAYLEQAGYRTGLFGKFLNGWNVAVNPPHWNDWAIYNSHDYSVFQVNEQGTLKYNYQYSTNYVADKAEQFLQSANDTNDAQPWFLYVAPTAGHEPWTPEPRYANFGNVPALPQTAAFFEQDRSDKPFWVRTSLNDADHMTSKWPNYLRTLKTADDLVERVML